MAVACLVKSKGEAQSSLEDGSLPSLRMRKEAGSMLPRFVAGSSLAILREAGENVGIDWGYSDIAWGRRLRT